jgi:broad specificity phosphatase PhoE
MTRVHLVRHGRTASNRERRTMGWLDEGIEPGWARGAAAVADVLAREPVDWVYRRAGRRVRRLVRMNENAHLEGLALER